MSQPLPNLLCPPCSGRLRVSWAFAVLGGPSCQKVLLPPRVSPPVPLPYLRAVQMSPRGETHVSAGSYFSSQSLHASK